MVQGENVIDLLRRHFALEVTPAGAVIHAAMSTGFVWSEQRNVVALAANRKYFTAALRNPSVAAVVAPASAVQPETPEKTVIVTSAADECFYFLHNQLLNADARKPLAEAEVHSAAAVDHSATLGPGVRIAPGARIGANCVLSGPVTVGRDVVIEPGVIIGCEGLFAKRIAGELVQIRHYGGVEIGAGAYIHSGAVIVRSAMYGEATRIGARAHIGVMSNIGHDAQVGAEAVISSNTVIAGRANIGDRAWIGASATVSNAISIGAGARVNIGAICIQNVDAGTEVSGNFAVPHTQHLTSYMRSLRKK